ncbi:MAG TPA: pyruvate dehydrogenase complex E1 component subunit beta [Thermoanaerobaculaceae bacterium]|nr:pyruvate dehydrogenase complex E1 component subunit beta [Thermoanaerobaculaceae bacterium]
MPETRQLSFSLAINEALHQAMAEDPRVILVGQGVKSPWYVGNTATGLLEQFGPDRVIDTPVSENAVTGAAVGAALAGMRPVVVHPRMDFMLYAFDPIINEAANWYYMSGGAMSVPVVFWGIINRGGEQAAQHSQALHSIFSHIPGLKVVAPSCPADAKGLMVAAIRDDNPVVFVDERWLYRLEEAVPTGIYEVPIGKARIVREGIDATIACFSYLVLEAVAAAEILEGEGVNCEVLDMRTLRPLDREALIASCHRTRRLVVCDVGWRTGGIGAEMVALVAESGVGLAAPPCRVALPDSPAPAARTLERAYYPRSETIAAAVRGCL